MLDVAMSEVSLKRPRIVAPIGQCITTGVTDHVRVLRLEGQLGHCASALKHAGKSG
jgi:hypothetical protein